MADVRAIEVKAASKIYREGGGAVRPLHDVSLEIGRGECVSLVGASGSGKSGLLHLMAGLDDPVSNEI
ncbi:MAG: ATP-binding cassette domain-containing protein [Candidatus Binatia bacterium]|nr:ATP-binding cassette domain-containing protein [Candidatus Binatia bacterium]